MRLCFNKIIWLSIKSNIKVPLFPDSFALVGAVQNKLVEVEGNMAEAVKFTEKTIDYAKNPRNQGDMADPTAIGEVSNPDCGDSTIIYLKVENDIITDVTFETFGCAAAVASSSILTEMIKGKTVEEAYKMTEEAVAEELGGLPEKKMHCSVIGVEAMRKAIENYRNGVVSSDED